MNTARRATLIAAAISFSIPVGVGIALRASLPHTQVSVVPLNSALPAAKTQASLPTESASRRAQPKYELYPKAHLCSLLRGITRLEAHRSARLSRRQARKILTVLKPWQTKPAMSYRQAQIVDLQIKTILTHRQQQEIDKLLRIRSFAWPQAGHNSIATKSGVAVRFVDIGMPSEPAQIEAMSRWVMRISSFTITVNPLYPPEAYNETRELPLLRQQKMQTDYRNCRNALAKIEQKAQMPKRKAI